MKTALTIVAGLLLLATLGACRRTDIRTVVLRTPGVTNAACAKIVQDTLARHRGVIGVRPDFQQGRVTVTYNSMILARKNLEFAVAGAGFDADNTLASSNAVAALPPECR